MNHQTFIALARHWLEDGEGACADLWNGTITETTTSTQKAELRARTGWPRGEGRHERRDHRARQRGHSDGALGHARFHGRPHADLRDLQPQLVVGAQEQRADGGHRLVLVKPLPKSVAAAMPACSRVTAWRAAAARIPDTLEQMNVPGVGESFFRYQAPQAAGWPAPLGYPQHTGLQAGRGGSQVRLSRGGRDDRLQGDAEELESFKGQKVIKIPAGTRTIDWDLTHVRE